MKKLLRFLYILVELNLIIGGVAGIFGSILASAENNIVMAILYAIYAGISLGGFGAILAMLIRERHYIWY